MKFGVNTFIWSAAYDSTVAAALPAIKEKGFDGIEVPLFHAADFRAAEIRKAAEANGLEVNACSVLLSEFSLISDNPDVRSKTLMHIRDLVKAAAEAGIQIIAGPLYCPVGYLPGR